MTTEHDQGDYVLVHKGKAKISRARKMIIGVMAIGAVAAMSNAGTFASFGATTTNDATFQTGHLTLNNKVSGANSCFSSGITTGSAENTDTNLDDNNTNCADFFGLTEQRPGIEATTVVTLENKSSYLNGKLYLFSPDADACVTNTGLNAKSGTGNLCNGTRMYVQEVTSPAGTVNSSSTCVYPKRTNAACDINGTLDASPLTGDDGTYATMDAFFSQYTGAADARDLGSFPKDGLRYFKVSFMLPSTAATATGASADNVYQNLKANLTIKWLLQDQ